MARLQQTQDSSLLPQVLAVKPELLSTHLLLKVKDNDVLPFEVGNEHSDGGWQVHVREEFLETYLPLVHDYVEVFEHPVDGLQLFPLLLLDARVYLLEQHA